MHHIGYNLLENNGNEVDIIKYTRVNYTHDPALKDTMVVGLLPESFCDGMDVGRIGVHLPQVCASYSP